MTPREISEKASATHESPDESWAATTLVSLRSALSKAAPWAQTHEGRRVITEIPRFKEMPTLKSVYSNLAAPQRACSDVSIIAWPGNGKAVGWTYSTGSQGGSREGANETIQRSEKEVLEINGRETADGHRRGSGSGDIDKGQGGGDKECGFHGWPRL